jgi:hypothetical protein
MVAKVALTAAQKLAKLKRRRHLYTKGEQIQIKSGIMKRKYNKKTNLKKLAKKNATPLAFGAGLGLGVLED